MKKFIFNSSFKKLVNLTIISLAIIMSLFNLFIHKDVAWTSEEFDQYNIVYVHEGDTLWSIARKHNKRHKDIRNLIYEIKYINNIKENQYIYPGDEIKIPSY